MNILIVSNGYPPSAFGGVEIYTSTLAKNLYERGHHISVFCREAAPNQKDKQIISDNQNGIPIFRIVNDYKKIQSLEETYSDSQIDDIFKNIIVDIAPDVIHFNHLIALSVNLPLVSSRLGIPSVITLHDYWPLCHRVNLIDWQQNECIGPKNAAPCNQCVSGGMSKLINIKQKVRVKIPIPLRKMLRYILPFGDGLPPSFFTAQSDFITRYDLFHKSLLSASSLISPSDYVKRMFVINGYPENRIQVLPLGLRYPNNNSRKRKPNEIVTFAFIGSLLPIKGVDIMVQAFLKESAENIRLNIYGRGDIIPSYSENLRRISESDKRISFKGPFSPELRDQIYQEFDVLLVPSIVPETFSMVVREALLFGKPVIASDKGALSEIIFHGINGFLVTPGDIESLSWYISVIGKDPGLLENFDLPGPINIQSISEHVEKMQEIYNQVSISFSS